MSITNPAPTTVHRHARLAFGPSFVLALATLIGVTLVVGGTSAWPRDFILPALSALFIAMAAIVVLVAWSVRRRPDPKRLTYWDVAGALVFIGICAGALVEPEQMVRLVATANHAD